MKPNYGDRRPTGLLMTGLVLLTAGMYACGPQASASLEDAAGPPAAETTAPRADGTVRVTPRHQPTDAAAIRVDVPRGTDVDAWPDEEVDDWPETDVPAIRVDLPRGTDVDAWPETAVESIRVTVPQGTELFVTLSTPVGSETSQVGDRLSATTVAPVVIGDRVPIPVGSTISGSVAHVNTGEKGLKVGEKGGSVVLAFDTVTTPDGRSTPIYASISSIARSKGKAAGIIGGSAAGGALLGKILGGSAKDAVLGAVIGGGIGTAVVAGTEGKHLTIPAATELTMILDQPVALAYNP